MYGEGIIAGFSADYLTKSPSGDKSTFPRRNRPPGTRPSSGVVFWGLGERVFIGAGGCFCLWRVFLYGEGDVVFDPRVGEDTSENNLDDRCLGISPLRYDGKN